MESIRLQGGVVPVGLTPGMVERSSSRGGGASPAQVATSRGRKSQRPWLNLSSSFPNRNPFEFLWVCGNRCNGVAVEDAAVAVAVAVDDRKKNENWIERILEVRKVTDQIEEGEDLENEEEGCSGCEVEYEDDDKNKGSKLGVENEEEKVEFDSNSFPRYLRRVNLSEAKMYAQLSYLSMLAYCIPKIKAEKLVSTRGLTYVTSSLEKKELLLAEKDQAVVNEVQEDREKEKVEDIDQKSSGYFINASAAYDIAASAASYLHSHANSILPFGSSKDTENGEMSNSGMHDESSAAEESKKASLKAATDSIASVVSANDDAKQSVADDLKSVISSPCEWFICDDNQNGTRYFIIQGSESLASWQANLLFEPVPFEGLDALVHRGIYEAANGIYEQMLPEIRSHLKSHGERATLRFSGHSLGGSLAMLVNLMLLIRGEVPESCLLPVVTFGAPFIMCRGNQLLTKLGLSKNHVQAMILTRDVVPRAFSAGLPSHAVDLLKAVNGNFRNHPCLSKQNIMYDPMGQVLVLQPDPRFSPPHSLLPPGSGLYLLTPPVSDEPNDKKSLRSAQLVFLNNPHPLEILSDRAAYGAEGTIVRDHDMKSYLKAIRVVIIHELNQLNKAQTDQRNKDLWPLVSPRGKITASQPISATSIFQHHQQLNFAGALQNGRQSLRRFSRLVASQHMQMLVLLLVPARLLVLGAYNALSFS